MPVAYKIYGKSLPETIDPEIRVCFSIDIPDTPQYRAALLGQLEWLGDWRCWEHTEEDYPIPPTRNVDAAQLFVSAVVDGRFGECDEMSCEDIADCIETNAGTQAAIADALENLGAPVPGRPMTVSRSASDVLPDNVRDEFGECIDDALWGAVLFLVQSGNRAVTDFFEQIEAASNTLETSAIVSGAIPAAGQYASAALEFADQLQENLAEGYAAGYTEAYENELACNIFCAARENCELTPDMLVDIVNLMLPDPEDMIDFGMVMARIGSGVFTGPEIPSAAFLIYFTALKFGQQFGATIGVRPLTDLMGLGADQLASDNWFTLCDDCPPDGEFITLLNPDSGLAEDYILGIEYVINSYDASGDNRLFLTAEGCFNVSVVSSSGYNPAPYLQPSNFWYAWDGCPPDGLQFLYASGTGIEQPEGIDTSPGVSSFVVSNAGLGAFSVTVVFSVP